MSEKGTLYLIPMVIADDTVEHVIPAGQRATLVTITHFLAENVRTARRYLSSLQLFDRIESLQFSKLDKHTEPEELNTLLTPVLQGHPLGVLSESGCPGIADPGALAVQYAHQHGIRVVPWVGPSSLLLALMASGLNGQQFAFHGYLPVDTREAAKTIRILEKESAAKKQTQLFIETPYRNKALFKNLIQSLNPHTRLCIAVNLTGTDEFICTKTVHQWRSIPVELPKMPTVYLFLA